MTLKSISLQDPAVSILGAQDLRATKGGLSPVRLPAWTQAQMPDPGLEMMARMTSSPRMRPMASESWKPASPGSRTLRDSTSSRSQELAIRFWSPAGPEVHIATTLSWW